MPIKQKNIPKKYTKLGQDEILVTKIDEDLIAASDVLAEKVTNGDITIMTKTEVKIILKEVIKGLVSETNYKLVKEAQDEVEEKITTSLLRMQNQILALFDSKTDELAQKICELLLTRHFNDEVDRKVRKILNEKNIKGKF